MKTYWKERILTEERARFTGPYNTALLFLILKALATDEAFKVRLGTSSRFWHTAGIAFQQF